MSSVAVAVTTSAKATPEMSPNTTHAKIWSCGFVRIKDTWGKSAAEQRVVTCAQEIKKAESPAGNRRVQLQPEVLRSLGALA